MPLFHGNVSVYWTPDLLWGCSYKGMKYPFLLMWWNLDELPMGKLQILWFSLLQHCMLVGIFWWIQYCSCLSLMGTMFELQTARETCLGTLVIQWLILPLCLDQDLEKEGSQPFNFAGIGGMSEFLGWVSEYSHWSISCLLESPYTVWSWPCPWRGLPLAEIGWNSCLLRSRVYLPHILILERSTQCHFITTATLTYPINSLAGRWTDVQRAEAAKQGMTYRALLFARLVGF